MLQIVLIALLSLLVQLVLPWWSLAVVAFLVCFWRGLSAGRAFVYGFIGIALIWLAYELPIHMRNEGVFTGRMSQLLFKTDSSVTLILVTAILGGLIGGLSGLSGFFVRQATGNQFVTHTAEQSRS